MGHCRVRIRWMSLTIGINHSDWAIKPNYISLLAIWKSIESYAIFFILGSTKSCAYLYMCKLSLTLFKRVMVKSPYRNQLFGPAFTRYPVFQWYPQSKEILWNLGMKCWNSAFTAQGLRVIIAGRTGRSRENICKSSGGAQEKRKTGCNSVYNQNWWKNSVWVPVILFCKIFIPSHMSDALLSPNWPFSSPNRLTLWITLMPKFHSNHCLEAYWCTCSSTYGTRSPTMIVDQYFVWCTQKIKDLKNSNFNDQILHGIYKALWSSRLQSAESF
jgi:hypothetical protein